MSGAVCDAGPLIHLDELHALDLLAGFAPIYVPQVVVSEVTYHRANWLRDLPVQITPIEQEDTFDEATAALTSALSLDAGERAALNILLGYPDYFFLTDDTAARLAAQTMGVRVHGTLGIIVRAARTGARSPNEVLALLQAIPNQSSLFIRKRMLDDFMERFRAEYRL